MRTGVISDRNFLIYAAGNAVSWTGAWMQRTGIGWLSWELTHSPSWVGLIALAQYLPLFVLGPLFGVTLDRVDRKRYAIVVQFCLILLGLALYALNIHALVRPRHTGGLFVQFAEGLHYTLANAQVRELLLLSVVTSILAHEVLELLPAFAGGEFDGGSNALAMLMAATGAGAIVAGYLLTRADNGSLPVLARRGSIGSGLAVAAFGAIGNYPAAVVVTVALGTLVTLASVGLQAILQVSINSDYRGRVVGLWGVANVAGPAVGGALLGGIAQVTSLRGATMVSGLLCALLCWRMMRRPASRFSRHQRPVHRPQAQVRRMRSRSRP